MLFNLPSSDSPFRRTSPDEAAIAQKADWIWSPHLAINEEGFIHFQLQFYWPGGECCFSVSADQHFDLALNRVQIARGPDTSPPNHWAYATYTGELEAGHHTLESIVWWAGNQDPLPQLGHRSQKANCPLGRMTWRGGFFLAAESEVFASILNTGHAQWECSIVQGSNFYHPQSGECHTIGASGQYDVEQFCNYRKWITPSVVKLAEQPNPYGLAQNGWRLVPSGLPEQRYHFRNAIDEAVIRSKLSADAFAQLPVIENTNNHCLTTKDLVIEPNDCFALLLDWQDYITAFPVIEASGQGLSVEILWAESLFDSRDGPSKGDRNRVEGKYFRGFGDRFAFSSNQPLYLRTHWWRAGRYWLVIVKNGNSKAKISQLGAIETGYPFKLKTTIQLDDEISRICLRGLKTSMHDCFADSPAYEQMMYAADTRIETKLSYYLTGDRRLGERAIELLNASRDGEGWTAMRFPSLERQNSATFSMIWAWMLHDHWEAWHDTVFIHRLRPSLRHLLVACENYENEEGLLHSAPGWPFIDWVPSWDLGCPPGARDSVNSMVNLFYLRTLYVATEIEKNIGDKVRASNLATKAAKLAQNIQSTFWNADRELIADNPEHSSFCEHAQVFAALLDVTDETIQSKLLDRFSTGLELEATCSVYFCYYLFEWFRHKNAHHLIKKYLTPWESMVTSGLLCPIEGPEPARSDCHAWASHPILNLK